MPTYSTRLHNTSFLLASGASQGASTLVSMLIQGRPELVFPTGRIVALLAHSTVGVTLDAELRAVWTDALDNRQSTPLVFGRISGLGGCLATAPFIGSAMEIAIWPVKALASGQTVSGLISLWGA